MIVGAMAGALLGLLTLLHKVERQKVYGLLTGANKENVIAVAKQYKNSEYLLFHS